MVDVADDAHKTKRGRPKNDKVPVLVRLSPDLAARLRDLPSGHQSAETENALRAYFKMAAA